MATATFQLREGLGTGNLTRVSGRINRTHLLRPTHHLDEDVSRRPPVEFPKLVERIDESLILEKCPVVFLFQVTWSVSLTTCLSRDRGESSTRIRVLFPHSSDPVPTVIVGPRLTPRRQTQVCSLRSPSYGTLSHREGSDTSTNKIEKEQRMFS